MMLPEGENCFLSLNSFNNLVVAENESTSKVIAENVVSFDAVCSSAGKIEVFFSTEQGSLEHISYDGKNLLRKVLLTSKNAKKKIYRVNALELKGRYHVFYCLDSEKRCLVHQIVSENTYLPPDVIDTIGKHFAYDVAKDEDSDIHIMYEDGGTLKYKRYVYSQKSYTSCIGICGANPRKISVNVFEDEVYGVFTEPKGAACLLCLVKVCSVPVKKTLMSVGRDAEVALNCKKTGVTIHMAEGGICYGIHSDSQLNISRPKTIAGSFGMRRIRFFNGNNSIRTYPANRHMLPADDYSDYSFEENCSNKLLPKGIETEKFANDCKAAFADKIIDIINGDLFLRLTRIEASVARLSNAVEKVIEEIKNNQTPYM